MQRVRKLCVICSAVLSIAATCAAAENNRLGKRIKDFSLRDHWGTEHRLSDHDDRQIVVVAFLGTQCPLARLYGSRLGELAESFSHRDVAFIGIDSNQQDSLREIGSFVRRHKIDFPVLKDVGNHLADQFGAIRTPEMFVLDSDRVIRYWGRVDDQYGLQDGVAYRRPEATRHDLAEAIRELLEGNDVTVPLTEAPGCYIGRLREPATDARTTYSEHIAPIFERRCVECHREGQIGPFSMTRYEEAAAWSTMIREVVEQERMPPWHADPEFGDFANDARLSEDEKRAIFDWVDAGAPQGDPSKASSAERQYNRDWAIGEPDKIFYMSKRPFEVPAEGVIEYQYFEVDPGWKEDVWIKAAEARPQSYEAVHHILVFIEPPGGHQGSFGSNVLAGFVPGSLPMFNGSVGLHIRAGSKLRFQVHYTASGTKQSDRSYVGVIYAKPEELQYFGRTGLTANVSFRIPPGAPNYKARATKRFRRDTILTALIPHLHVRGKSFRYEVIYPGGGRETLLNVPNYDFNWQTTYQLAQPKHLPRGTKLVCTARWDNSEDNPSNPDHSRTVRWGDQTWDEMMIGWYVEAVPNTAYQPPEEN